MTNHHDNDNNKEEEDRKRVTSFEEFLRRRFPTLWGTGQPLPPTPIPPSIDPQDIPTSPQAVLAAARLEMSAYFNFIADPNNTGLKILRANPLYQVLDAVWNDDLGKFFSTMALAQLKQLNRRWYWHFPNDMKDVSFVTPAHLVRTHLLAVAVAKHGGDFSAPDSEGRTPLYYIARHGRDSWLVPLLVSRHNVDPYDSGRCSHDHSLEDAKGEKYEEPLLRAIRYANMHIIDGFLNLAPQSVDMSRPRGTWLQTPLMLAVQEAHDAAMKYPGHGPGRAELQRRLWIVRELAAEPHIDVTLKDIAGNTARDYALLPAVANAYDAGLAERKKNGHLPRILRKTDHGPQP
ncbi:MAG: hypothetical protein KKA05_06910 [Alphaproteobacteria bacterium]|nr:hypothetical protein [Alphaproteobacteria bacterium]MBU0859153.1 hypothetical protein [Alphaproteobacteria bacterium]